MKKFLWSPYSSVYHTRENLRERCNSDQLKHRRESDTAPLNKRPCQHCWVKEAQFEDLR